MDCPLERRLLQAFVVKHWTNDNINVYYYYWIDDYTDPALKHYQFLFNILFDTLWKYVNVKQY